MSISAYARTHVWLFDEASSDRGRSVVMIYRERAEPSRCEQVAMLGHPTDLRAPAA